MHISNTQYLLSLFSTNLVLFQIVSLGPGLVREKSQYMIFVLQATSLIRPDPDADAKRDGEGRTLEI